MKKYLLFAVLTVILFSCKKNKIVTQPAPLDPTLVAYYPMDGDAKDYTKFANHGTITVPLTSDRKNQSKKAYQFEDGYFQSYNIPVTLNKQYTFCFWMKMNAYDDGMAVMEITKNQESRMNPIMWQYQDSVYLTTSSNIHNRMLILSMTRIKSGTEQPKWIHVLWTVSNDTTNLYVNGLLKETKQISWPDFQNVDLTLGNAGNSKAQNPWTLIQGIHQTPSKVSIDEVRVYNRVLSLSEIKKLAE